MVEHTSGNLYLHISLLQKRSFKKCLFLTVYLYILDSLVFQLTWRPISGHIQYFLVSRRFMLIVGTLYAAFREGYYTDKKEKQIFLIYKEIKRDRVQSHI
jgi:hypothetical protein